jgi:uncharacterized protein YkwD
MTRNPSPWLRALISFLSIAVVIATVGGCSASSDEEEEVAESDDVGEDSAALSTGILDTEEIAFLSKINAYRAGKGLRKLRVSIALTRASIAHSKDMAATNVLRHESSDGTLTFDRIKHFYNHNTSMAENVASGYTTGADVFTGWRNSPEHNSNMISTALSVIGIAREAAADGTMYWTTDFGGYTDALLSAGVGTVASNGSFEVSSFGVATFGAVRTLNKWHTSASGGGAVARTAGGSVGSYGMRVRDVNGGSAAATQVVQGAGGVNYRVTAKSRRVAGADAQSVRLEFLDASFARLQSIPVSSGTSTTYAPVQSEGVSPAGTRYVRVVLFGSGAAGQASTSDYDDVRIVAW